MTMADSDPEIEMVTAIAGSGGEGDDDGEYYDSEYDSECYTEFSNDNVEPDLSWEQATPPPMMIDPALLASDSLHRVHDDRTMGDLDALNDEDIDTLFGNARKRSRKPSLTREEKTAARRKYMSEYYKDGDFVVQSKNGHVLANVPRNEMYTYANYLPKGVTKHSMEAVRLGGWSLVPKESKADDGVGRQEASSSTRPMSDNPKVDEYFKQAAQFWSSRSTGDLGFGKAPIRAESDSGESEYDDDADQNIQGVPMESGVENEIGSVQRSEFSPHGVSNLDIGTIGTFDEHLPPRGHDGSQRRGRGRPRKRGRGAYKWALAGTEHDPAKRRAEQKAEQKQRRRERGRGRRGNYRGRGGHRKPVDPGPDFKYHHATAMAAFMDGDLEEAKQSVRAAIEANPEVFEAHTLLSEILLNEGKKDDALFVLTIGANTQREPGPWLDLAQRTLEIGGENITIHTKQQALFAYSKALQISKNDGTTHYPARKGKRDMNIQLGNYHEALKMSKNMLYYEPGDMENVRCYAELCVKSGYMSDYVAASTAYESAFVLHEKEDSFADDAERWSHVNVYLEVLELLGARIAPKGLYMLKLLARWILGRKDEAFWNKYRDDDREFDVENDRRNFVSEFQQGKASRDKARYGESLPLELRIKLGLFRISMGMQHHAEGVRHLDHLLRLADEVEYYYDLFIKVADTLKGFCLWEHAIKFYEAVKNGLEINDEGFSLDLAKCYVQANLISQAEDMYREVLRDAPDHLLARVELARMYERIGWDDQAVFLMKEVRSLARNKHDLLHRLGLGPKPYTSGNTKQLKPLLPRPQTSNGQGQAGTYAEFWVKTPNVRTSQTVGPAQPPLNPVQQALPPFQACHLEKPSRRHQSRRGSGSRGPKTERKHPRGRSGDMQLDEEAVKKNFAVVKELWSVVEDGVDEQVIGGWLASANALVEIFQQNTSFYPGRKGSQYSRNRSFKRSSNQTPLTGPDGEALHAARAMLERLQPEGNEGEDDETMPDISLVSIEGVPTEFLDIDLDEWQRIFIDLALHYARRAEQSRCYDLIKNGLLKATVFLFHRDRHLLSLAAGLCCALLFNDSAFVTEIGRRYITKGDCRAGASFQLLAAANRLCFGCGAGSDAREQKFMARMVKMMDFMILPPQARDKIHWDQHSSLQSRLERLQGPAELDAGILILFGNMMLLQPNQHSAALPYYLRALAAQPMSYSINLCVAMAYIICAMKRQTDNRQYGIQQGLSFLYRYRDLRMASGQPCDIQEAEYNVAKTWHLLGLTHLAIPGYEKVLELSEAVQADYQRNGRDGGEVNFQAENLATEAAFALQQLFSLVGNEDAARMITEEWLVI